MSQAWCAYPLDGPDILMGRARVELLWQSIRGKSQYHRRKLYECQVTHLNWIVAVRVSSEALGAGFRSLSSHKQHLQKSPLLYQPRRAGSLPQLKYTSRQRPFNRSIHSPTQCVPLQAVPLQLLDVKGGPASPNESDQKQVRDTDRRQLK